MIGKMTLEGHLKKTGMIGMITPESISKLLGILGNKKNTSNQMNSFTQKKLYWNFSTNARYFPFEARKETHEQRKTKMDVDEFRSGTTNITHFIRAPLGARAYPCILSKYCPSVCASVRLSPTNKRRVCICLC
jgi:hypothetical protein